MNRRNVISIFALALMVPATLIARPPKNKPESPSCKDCKKCGRACKCDCKKGCKCKPGCCKTEQPPTRGPQKPRGFDGKTPSFRPPNSRPPSGFDRRTPGFGPPSHGRPPQARPSSDRSRLEHSSHIIPKKNHEDYEMLMRKFDENKDGKITEEEKKTAYLWFRRVFDSVHPGQTPTRRLR